MNLKQYLNQFNFIKKIKIINKRCAVYKTKNGPAFVIFQTNEMVNYIKIHTSRLSEMHAFNINEIKDKDLILFKTKLVECFENYEIVYKKIKNAIKEIENG